MDGTPDDHLRLIADRHRRILLDHLREASVTTRDDLADVLRRVDSDPESDTDGETRRCRFAVGLHHTHLPALADAGVIEYDPDDGTVVYRPDERVERLLDALSTDRTRTADPDLE